MKIGMFIVALLMTVTLSGCTLTEDIAGPDYRTPSVYYKSGPCNLQKL